MRKFECSGGGMGEGVEKNVVMLDREGVGGGVRTNGGESDSGR
jgi:hypothetical protein